MWKLFLLCALAVARAEIAEEEDVLVLKKSNFDAALEAHPNILVEFYAPGCGQCNAVAAEFTKAAGMLKAEGSKIRVGKVDATKETDLAQEYGVEEYPTIKLFRVGDKASPKEYPAGLQAEEMVSWLKKHTGAATVAALNGVTGAESLIADNEVVVIGFFKDPNSADAQAFVKAVKAIDDIDVPFALTSDQAVFSKFEVSKDGVALFNQFNEGRNMFHGKMTKENLQAFVKTSLNLLMEMSEQVNPAITPMAGLNAHS